MTLTLYDIGWQGVTIQMMGSATALPVVPVEKTVFEEDLTEQQLATHVRLLHILTIN